MGLADQTAMREAAIELPLDEAGLAAAAARLQALGDAAQHEVASQGVAAVDITLRSKLHLRYQGTDTALAVDFNGLAQLQQDFEAAYRQRFAFLMPGRALVIEAVSVEAVGRASAMTHRSSPRHPCRIGPHPTPRCACTAASGATRRCMCASPCLLAPP
jgi:5-oxoprolinase (ATP-hydrolysing)